MRDEERGEFFRFSLIRFVPYSKHRSWGSLALVFCTCLTKSHSVCSIYLTC